jgi:hypothetical protein
MKIYFLMVLIVLFKNKNINIFYYSWSNFEMFDFVWKLYAQYFGIEGVSCNLCIQIMTKEIIIVS